MADVVEDEGDVGVVFGELGFDEPNSFEEFFMGDGGLSHLDECSHDLNVDLRGSFASECRG